jgi:hypothetical protein
MKFGSEKAIGIVAPAIAGAAILIFAVGALLSMTGIDGPLVGDIITFENSHELPPDTDLRLLVRRPNQFACVLDLNTLRQSGGSVVIEARMPGDPHAYQLHWAGERTTGDRSDCGKTADLIVDHRDMSKLASAAGGYGVGRKPPSGLPTTTPF